MLWLITVYTFNFSFTLIYTTVFGTIGLKKNGLSFGTINTEYLIGPGEKY